MFRQLVLGTIVLVSAGCATSDQAPVVAAGGAQGVVSGQALYRERIAVPPGTQLEVLLEDVSRADTRAEIIGSVSVTNIGNPPYSFSIPYERSGIVAAHRYAVRAQLTHEGRLLFTTDQSYPVITGGNPSEVTLLLRSATQPDSIAPSAQSRAQSLGILPATFKGDLPCADCSAIQYQLDLFADNSYDLLTIYRGKSSNSETRSGIWEKSGVNSISLLGGRTKIQFAIISANSLRLLNQNGGPIESTLNYTLTRDTQTSNAQLLNTSWRMTRLIDQPARRFPNQREPQIVLRSDGTVAGSDGCNRISGGYRHTGTSMSFTQIAATRMACMNGMDQAGRFTNALGTVARYHISGRHLELFDSSEAFLMRFEAVFVQ